MLDFATASESWLEWKKKFLRYCDVMELGKKDEKQQISTLIYVMGDDAESIYEQLTYATGQSKDKFKDVVEAFEKHFMPRSNNLHYRVQFHNRSQQQGENVDAYIQELHLLAAKCEFANKDDMLRDRLLSGMLDKQLSVEIQMQDDVTLSYVAEKMKAKSQLVDNIKKEKTVAAVGITKSPSSPIRMQGYYNKQSKQYGKQYEKETTRSTGPKMNQQSCKSCKSYHPQRRCPAYDKKCRKCGKMNHFSKACWTQTASYSKSVSSIQTESDRPTEVPEFFIGAIDFGNDSDNWNIEVSVNDANILCKVDTGAQCNVMPLSVFKTNFPELPIDRTNVTLTAYTGINIEVVGQVQMEVKYKDTSFQTTFYITPSEHAIPVIGLALVRKMGLVPSSVNALSIGSYEDVFTGLGRLEGEHKIKLKPDAEPVVCVPRRVPESIKPKLKTELESSLMV
ncbi:uncharacterized protein [Watersipora subatra]|uniref:uncharacterized protein n=1 Tax=Watersipora subatra TaxID=2589382 RepID=UPI00355C480D